MNLDLFVHFLSNIARSQSIEHHHLRTIGQSPRWQAIARRTLRYRQRERIIIDISWWGWAGSFTIFGIWR